MSDKCEKCGVAQNYHPPGGLECVENQLAQSREREEEARRGERYSENMKILAVKQRDAWKAIAQDAGGEGILLWQARAEKAEADLKTNAGLLAHQTDLAREAEIGKVKAERLREAFRAAVFCPKGTLPKGYEDLWDGAWGGG